MSIFSSLLQRAAVLAGMFAALACPAFADGISASANLTGVADPVTAGLYDYSITLTSTGSTSIGTFWFAWVPGAGFLTVAPTSFSSPGGWAGRTTSGGLAIQWTTTTAALMSGQSLSGFNFTSTETISQLLGTVPSGPNAGIPDLTSYVYVTGTTGSSARFTVGVAPEPSSLILSLTGLGVVAGSLRTRFRRSASYSSPRSA